MADEEKPQKAKTAKSAVKKAARKKATSKKRATPKRAAAKKHAKKRDAAVSTPATAAKNDTQPPPSATIEVSVEHPTSTSAATSKPRYVWWRAALMAAVVVLLFVTIRNAVHKEPAIAEKGMAPNPWGETSPSMASEQPHPWELAPAPQAGDFNTQQPNYSPPSPQPAYRPEPWQPMSDTAQPYYPPPPGPYGTPPPADEAVPYPR
jgi:hypothetical protein